MEFIVCKFGGTSVAATDTIRQVEKVIEADPRRRCIVLSAPGKAKGFSVKITDLLIAAVQKAAKKENCDKEISDLKDRYRAIYAPLGIKTDHIEEVVSEIDKRLAATKDTPAKFRDYVVAVGEELNCRLFADYLISRGKKAIFVSPRDAGMFVTAQFGDAQPLAEASLKLASLKKLCAESIVVFPGFYGFTKQGDIATFSRGGSDLTGAILAEAIDAVEYENWTDVNGIFSANPKLIDSPLQIEALTYKEMRELSYMGFNVFHEEAVRPAMKKKIPIRLRNTFNLENSGTLIVAQRLPSERDVIGIASDGGYCSFSLEKFLMNREKGFGRRLLSIFEDRGLSYEHCPSGVDNMSVILDQGQLTPETVNAIVRDIEDKLDPDELRTEFGIALVAVVGEGLLHKIGVLSTAAGALSKAGINIKMVNQGSSEISMIFGIDASDEKKALSALYQEFFK
jgi:aspartate kinase